MKSNTDKISEILFETIDELRRRKMPEETAACINALCRTAVENEKVNFLDKKFSGGRKAAPAIEPPKQESEDIEDVEELDEAEEDDDIGDPESEETTAEIKSLLSQPKIPQGDKSASYVHIGGAGQRAMNRGG